MKKLIISFLILSLFPNFSFATHWSHIQTAYTAMMSHSTNEMQDIGNYYDWFLTSGFPDKNFTPMYAVNPDINVWHYVYTTIYIRESSPPLIYYDTWNSWKNYATENEYDIEDVFLHYKYDRTFSAGQYPSDAYSSVMVNGYDVGLIPGFIDGESPKEGSTATIRENSKLPGRFTSQLSYTYTISSTSGAVRSSDVSTITVTQTHGLIKGDRVTIAGVSDSSFNGTFNVDSTPTTTIFTYSQTGFDTSVIKLLRY